MAVRHGSGVSNASTLSPIGDNLVNVIATIPRRRREELAQEFVKLVPVFGDVDIRPSGSGMHAPPRLSGPLGPERLV